MKRKDGRAKARPLRTMPRYSGGFRQSEAAAASGFHDSPRNPYRVLSLFAGCGGLDLGMHGGFEWCGQLFSRLRFDIVAAHDWDPDCVGAYALNLSPATRTDLSRILPERLPPADVVIGGFPCQDFSSSGTKLGTSSERGRLYQVLVDYAAYHRPRLIVGENVPLLAKLHGGVYLREIERDFRRAGYETTIWTVVCQNNGLPQSRTRLFLIMVPEGSPSPPPYVSNGIRIGIDEAIHDLEDVRDESIANQSQYFVADVATAGGGQGDHRNERGRVAYTIRANSRGRIQFHYTLPRRLTVRECARLQGFPDQFIFPFSTQRNLKLIGNAVPPIIGHRVATRLLAYLDGEVQSSVERQLALAF